jgi:hypothetical protein
MWQKVDSYLLAHYHILAVVVVVVADFNLQS